MCSAVAAILVFCVMNEEHEADTINWNLTISLSAWWEPTFWFWNLGKLYYTTLSLETQKEEQRTSVMFFFF